MSITQNSGFEPYWTHTAGPSHEGAVSAQLTASIRCLRSSFQSHNTCPVSSAWHFSKVSCKHVQHFNFEQILWQHHLPTINGHASPAILSASLPRRQHNDESPGTSQHLQHLHHHPPLLYGHKSRRSHPPVTPPHATTSTNSTPTESRAPKHHSHNVRMTPPRVTKNHAIR